MGERARVGCLALVLAATLVAPGCGTSEAPQRPERLVLATPPSPSLAPYYVAEAEGYFEDVDLNVEVLEQDVGLLAMSALLAGEVDIAAVADPPISRAVLEGESPEVIATFDRVASLTYVVARRDRGITRVDDLVGKRVGVIHDNIGDYFLHVYLVTSGIDPASVEIVYLEAKDMVSAVVSGEVDAISWAPPSTLRAAEALGDNAAVLERPGLYTVTWSFVTSGSADSEDEDRFTRFLEAIDRANAFIEANPEEAQTITAEGAGQSLADIQRHWDNHQFALSLDQALILTLQDVASWMQGGMGDVPSFLPCLETAPLRSVKPEAVTVVEPGDGT